MHDECASAAPRGSFLRRRCRPAAAGGRFYRPTSIMATASQSPGLTSLHAGSGNKTNSFPALCGVPASRHCRPAELSRVRLAGSTGFRTMPDPDRVLRHVYPLAVGLDLGLMLESGNQESRSLHLSPPQRRCDMRAEGSVPRCGQRYEVEKAVLSRYKITAVLGCNRCAGIRGLLLRYAIF